MSAKKVRRCLKSKHQWIVASDVMRDLTVHRALFQWLQCTICQMTAIEQPPKTDAPR